MSIKYRDTCFSVAPEMSVNHLITAVAVLGCLSLTFHPSQAVDLPGDFEDAEVMTGLASPSNLVFSPDGRMFVCERITGALRVATFDATSQTWDISPTPFYTFDVPKDGTGQPSALRSSGLRDIAFDPDFQNNGFVYAFYMKHGVLQNRVVRVQASSTDPNVANPASETLLMEFPSNDTAASGSHNGGSLAFGPYDLLYVATGDGWNGGDAVQSLATFTGKVVRITRNGEIITQNPFYETATGNYRAIYALGLRNPFSLTRDPTTGSLYINDVVGSDKGSIHLISAAANYGHQGFGGIGEEAIAWANGGDPTGRVITGGVWYPTAGNWPIEYRGRYFVTMWGPNNSSLGHINYVDASDASVHVFASQVGRVDSQSGNSLKPITPEIGPDGDLYYLATTYTTGEGAVHRIAYIGPAVDVDAPPRPLKLTSYPNPFNPTTTIAYTIPRGGMVRVTVHDTAGHLLGTLLEERRPAGSFELSYHPIDAASGVRIVRLWFEGIETTRKLVVLK